MKNILIYGSIIIALVSFKMCQRTDYQEDIYTDLIEACGNNAFCVDLVRNYGKQCISENLISHKRGKYSSNYELDQAGFGDCVESMLANREVKDEVGEEGMANNVNEVSYVEYEPLYENGGRVEVVHTGSHKVRLLNEVHNQSSAGLTKLKMYGE